MAEITLDELTERLAALSRARLLELQRQVMGAATDELEEQVKANIQARMTMRSRSLLVSVRQELRATDDTVDGVVSAGGSYGGLEVAHALLQELGGTIEPKNAAHLAIPVDANLTGPGIARYLSPKQMPFAAFRPVRGRKARWIVYDKRNDQAFFLLVTSVDVPGKFYMRDALAMVYPSLPARLLAAATAGVEGEA